MVYAGAPYEYDVFFSYTYAEKAAGNTPDFRKWSLALIDNIRGPLALAINALDDGEFTYCLDRDHITPGSRLTERLREAVQKSALMVLFVSPHYFRKPWCVKELEWFLEQAKLDGRGGAHCVAVEVQSTPAALWPKDLCDSTGVPLLYHSFMDAEGEPLAFAEFLAGDIREGWGKPVRGITADIKTKLKAFKQRSEAQSQYRDVRPATQEPTPQESPPQTAPLEAAVSPAPPDRPVETLPRVPPMVYLEAEPPDHAAWRNWRRVLEPSAIILPEVEDNERPVRIEEDDILNVYKYCDGLVLLRSRADDGIGGRLMAAVRDQKALRQIERKAISLAVLDEVKGQPIALAKAFKVPQIATEDDDWPRKLLAVMRPEPAWFE